MTHAAATRLEPIPRVMRLFLLMAVVALALGLLGLVSNTTTVVALIG